MKENISIKIVINAVGATSYKLRRTTITYFVHATNASCWAGLGGFLDDFKVGTDGSFVLQFQLFEYPQHQSVVNHSCYLGDFISSLALLLNLSQSSSLFLHILLFLLFNLTAETIFFLLLHRGQSLVFFLTQHLQVSMNHYVLETKDQWMN